VSIRGTVGEALVFPRPTRKRLLGVLGALVFVAVGVTFMVFARRFGPSPVIFAIGGASILLFGYVGAAAGLAMVRGRVEGLALFPVGLGWAGGGVTYLVPWAAISSVGLRLVRFGLSPSIVLSVQDPRVVQANPFGRLSMLFCRPMFGADVLLQNTFLGIAAERLIPIIERYRTSPEHRREIGTPDGLAVVKQLL
jgi:hypothetical protein